MLVLMFPAVESIRVACDVAAFAEPVYASLRVRDPNPSWGNGSRGELGYGKDEMKSSAKPEFDSDLVRTVRDTRCSSCGTTTRRMQRR
jgi:hypothetical protein